MICFFLSVTTARYQCFLLKLPPRYYMLALMADNVGDAMLENKCTSTIQRISKINVFACNLYFWICVYHGVYFCDLHKKFWDQILLHVGYSFIWLFARNCLLTHIFLKLNILWSKLELLFVGSELVALQFQDQGTFWLCVRNTKAHQVR